MLDNDFRHLETLQSTTVYYCWLQVTLVALGQGTHWACQRERMPHVAQCVVVCGVYNIPFSVRTASLLGCLHHILEVK